MDITAVVATSYGGPEVLSLVREQLSDPEPGQVVVEVRAAGTNPIDFKLYSGTYGDDPAQLPMRLGLEVSGVVRSVDDDVVGPSGPIHVGDEVIVFYASGGYASVVVALAQNVLYKPAAMTFEEASGLMLTGTTAVHALTSVNVRAGDTLVVHGASGGVGLMAVQLAVADGVRVIATAGGSQHEMLRGLGAEPVLYGEGLLTRIQALAPDGVDAAIDLIGTDEAGDVSLALVAVRERLVTIVGSGRAGQLGVKAIGNGPGAEAGTEVRAAARLELLRRVEAGTLRVIVDATYSLSDVATAHRELAGGHAHGKIVLVP